MVLATGCAGWRPQTKAEPSVAQQREARYTDAVRSFEQERDRLQLEAALDRYNQGDAAGCESRLMTLAQRRPDFAPARLRLAELAWSRGDAAAAEEHYLAVLTSQPDSAEAHHGLGMLLEANGRFKEAQTHLARALELEPQNELYRLAATP